MLVLDVVALQSAVSPVLKKAAVPTDYAIELNGVNFALDGRELLSRIDMAIENGRVTAIMGTSGAGKTTLLRLITGQLRAQSGRVRVLGREVGLLSQQELYQLRLQMGFLFQQGALFSDLSVFENVAFSLREHTRLPESLIRNIVLMKLHIVGLRGASALRPSELSGGMARRVALARAIAMDPAILLCDEPFTGLDPIATGVVQRLLRTMNEALGMTVIVVSHDVPEIESFAHMSFLLANGRIAAAGRPGDLRRSQIELVRQFMDGAADGPIPFHYPAPDYYSQLLGR